jgi:hypothetical protein
LHAALALLRSDPRPSCLTWNRWLPDLFALDPWLWLPAQRRRAAYRQAGSATRVHGWVGETPTLFAARARPGRRWRLAPAAEPCSPSAPNSSPFMVPGGRRLPQRTRSEAL